MEFSKVIGKIDKTLVQKAQQRMTECFLSLSISPKMNLMSNKGYTLMGDPLILSLVYPMEHVVTCSLPTAATDGKRMYWNPKFVLKLRPDALRLVLAHESWHALYMHVDRRGYRHPKLWNIAVDYVVNSFVMDDLQNQNLKPDEFFKKEMGDFITLSELLESYKDPAKARSKAIVRKSSNKQVDPMSPLSDEEIDDLEEERKNVVRFYADPNLEKDMRRPEKIYDMLMEALPKCPDCGKLGAIPQKKKSKKDKDKEEKDKNGKDKKDGKDKGKGKGKKKEKGEDQEKGDEEKSDQHEHGENGEPCDHDHGNEPGDGEGDGEGDSQEGCGHGGCDTCGGGPDIFGLGDTMDDHMDSKETQEETTKRIQDAIFSTKKMAGRIPAGLEEEVGILTEPKISWTDVIRNKIQKAKNSGQRNDYTRFRARPMFAGLLVPKKRSSNFSFGCLLDTSGSMSSEDMAFGLSQLLSLDPAGDGVIVPADCEIYWDKATKVQKISKEDIAKVKVVGRGGTMFAGFFDDYKKKIGDMSFLIMITDGYLFDGDLAAMKNPGIPVYWVITSDHKSFHPPFGKVMPLHM